MLARVTRFEGSEPAKLQQELGDMRDQMQRGLTDESIDQMAEQVKDQFERDEVARLLGAIKRTIVLADKEKGSSAMVLFCEPPRSTPKPSERDRRVATRQGNACLEQGCFRRSGPGIPLSTATGRGHMLDQQTKQQLQENFHQIKPQIQQAFPDVPEQELSKAQSNPDQLVSTIEQKTGHAKDQIEQQLKQLVSRV